MNLKSARISWKPKALFLNGCLTWMCWCKAFQPKNVLVAVSNPQEQDYPFVICSHRTIEVRKDVQDHQVQFPTRYHRAHPSTTHCHGPLGDFGISRDGGSITSLGSLFQCFTTLPVKNVILLLKRLYVSSDIPSSPRGYRFACQTTFFTCGYGQLKCELTAKLISVFLNWFSNQDCCYILAYKQPFMVIYERRITAVWKYLHENLIISSRGINLLCQHLFFNYWNIAIILKNNKVYLSNLKVNNEILCGYISAKDQIGTDVIKKSKGLSVLHESWCIWPLEFMYRKYFRYLYFFFVCAYSEWSRMLLCYLAFFIEQTFLLNIS